MRQQPITDDGFSDAEALRVVRGLAGVAGPHRRSEPRLDGDSRAVLTRTVEDEVIPRLLTARRPQGSAAQGLGCGGASAPELRLEPRHITALVSLLLEGTQAEVTGFVESLRVAGVTLDALCLELLSPAARRLGVMWEEDICDFTDVTVGVLRLGDVLRLITDAFGVEASPQPSGPRALLAQMPGEQHGLGLAMVVYFFRRAGWCVQHLPKCGRDDLIGLVRSHAFDLVGISVACGDRMEALAADIHAIRGASCNQSVGIMVGGKPFIDDPHLASLVGADTTATDGKLAVVQAQALVSGALVSRPLVPSLAQSR